MDFLKIILTSLSSLVVMFVLSKIMGEKQISQMSLFDYIIGISIGSIAAEMATELEAPHKPLLSMIIYGVSAYLISLLTGKSKWARKVITGRPIILFDKGVIYRSNLKKARLDINEFLTLCRISGYFDLSQLQTAILEHNGSMSFLPVATQRPVNAFDMNIPVKQNYILFNFILDGKISYDNLKMAGKNEEWLRKKLKAQGYKSEKEIFLASCDNDDNLSVYPMIYKKKAVDMFE